MTVVDHSELRTTPQGERGRSRSIVSGALRDSGDFLRRQAEKIRKPEEKGETYAKAIGECAGYGRQIIMEGGLYDKAIILPLEPVKVGRFRGAHNRVMLVADSDQGGFGAVIQDNLTRDWRHGFLDRSRSRKPLKEVGASDPVSLTNQVGEALARGLDFRVVAATYAEDPAEREIATNTLEAALSRIRQAKKDRATAEQAAARERNRLLSRQTNKI